MSDTPEQLNDANREFELIKPTYSMDFTRRYTDGFQVKTITAGLDFIGATAYTAPGSPPNQTGPSMVANFFTSGGNGAGDFSTSFYNIVNNPPTSGTANPESVPPTGPEEKLRYSCLSGKCIQDPNGDYLGIEECQTDGCDVGGGGGGIITSGCNCGFGPSHTVFKAQITGITCSSGGLLSGSRHYWTYSWTEVTTGTPRTNLTRGDAVNEYELTIDDNGGNIVPSSATLTRKRIPTGAKVPMLLDATGVPWFFAECPLQVSCT